MSKVICFGEALIDFLNTGKRIDGDLALNEFTQFPGGAPANAAVAVAKLGGESLFMGQVGQDPFGDFLISALQAYGVDTSVSFQHPSAPTALAYVFLDDQGERSFLFRRNNTADLRFSENQVPDGLFSASSILHFCSNTLTESLIEQVTCAVLKRARVKGAFISFDVNLRHSLWSEGKADKHVVNRLVYESDLVKFSYEELEYLSEGNVDAYVQACLDKKVKALVVTNGAKPIMVFTKKYKGQIIPPLVNAIDTTGGGDAFIGAILYKLSKTNSPALALEDIGWVDALVEFASSCGAYAVSKQGAFPAFPTLSDIHTPNR